VERNPIFIDRVERKFLIGVGSEGVAGLWRDLGTFLRPYGLEPIPEITAVGTVYFDNRDYDLLRCILLIRRCHILVRIRAYENFGEPSAPIKEYWMEVKNRSGERRKKRRFRMKRSTFKEFLNGVDVTEQVLADNQEEGDVKFIRELYAETRETFFTWGLRPALLVTYKRVAFQGGSERLSLDWDVQYYPADNTVYDYDTWKYPVEPPAGRADKVIMEFKYPEGTLPGWIDDLQRKYPLWERNYVKPVEGMGFLFQGPLRDRDEATSFTRMVEAYKSETQQL
jgi:hypothetical protein